jgi:hypothetical protein
MLELNQCPCSLFHDSCVILCAVTQAVLSRISQAVSSGQILLAGLPDPRRTWCSRMLCEPTSGPEVGRPGDGVVADGEWEAFIGTVGTMATQPHSDRNPLRRCPMAVVGCMATG